MRSYQYHDDVLSNGRGLLRDVQPTPDGGFIAVGMAFNQAPYSQDVWVIKTDSMGCIEPGCNLIQGMQTQITNLRDVLKVSPNPVAAGSSIQVSTALPKNFAAQGQLKLTVVSSDGRLVHEQRIGDPSSSQHMVAPLSSGLYHVHMSDATRWISGAKLVVE
ncbi:MAG TPA: T9SS type A sorting domain-containing protein [Flavobacteriales bacterium]|nr:T9SS type A sorting domain-containing protein [Flavobacteriales bacterium]